MKKKEKTAASTYTPQELAFRNRIAGELFVAFAESALRRGLPVNVPSSVRDGLVSADEFMRAAKQVYELPQAEKPA
jgi:hypothetical protein